MSEKQGFPEQNISTTLPIAIAYNAIETMLKNKFVGEILKKEKAEGKATNYAEIMDVTLSNSSLKNFDLELILKLKMLTFLYRNKNVDIKIDASISFNREDQKVAIKDYEIDSMGLNFFADNILESVVNKFMYSKLKEKLNVDLMPKLQEELASLNVKLANKFEAKKGINIVGAMDKLQITEISARKDKLWIFVSLDGWAVIEIDELEV